MTWQCLECLTTNPSDNRACSYCNAPNPNTLHPSGWPKDTWLQKRRMTVAARALGVTIKEDK